MVEGLLRRFNQHPYAELPASSEAVGERHPTPTTTTTTTTCAAGASHDEDDGNMSATPAPRPRVHYRKLDWSKGEMRFLEIKAPSRGCIDEPIVCRLVQVPLENDVDFIAISSLLGDDDETEKIQINGQCMPIPAHIAQALRHTRAVFAPHTQPRSSSASSDGSGTTRPRWLSQLMRHFGSRGGAAGDKQDPVLRIWIDCLCINADDKRERTQQRSIMSRVYWKAQTVVGWVGLKVPYTDAGIQLIRDFDEAMPTSFHEPGDRIAHPEHYSPHHEWAKPIIHHFDASAVGAIGCVDFLSRSFFKRRWIVEEMALAKVATFLIGDAIVSWKQLLRLNLAMEEFKDYPSNVCPPETRPLIHNLPLETIHTLLDEFERRRAMEKAEGLNRSMAHSYDSKDTGSF